MTAAGHNLTSGAAEARAGPAIIGIDEFSALGADNVIALLARGREAGVSVLLATQELADLDRAAPRSTRSGPRQHRREDRPPPGRARVRADGRADGGDCEAMGGDAPDRWRRLFGGHGGSRGTRRQVERFIVDPNEIKTLRTGEAVVIVKQPQARVARVRVAPTQRQAPGARDASEGGSGRARRDADTRRTRRRCCAAG